MGLWYTARVYLVNGYEHDEHGKPLRGKDGKKIPILVATEYEGHGESEQDAVADIEFHDEKGNVMTPIELIELAEIKNEIKIETTERFSRFRYG